MIEEPEIVRGYPMWSLKNTAWSCEVGKAGLRRKSSGLAHIPSELGPSPPESFKQVRPFSDPLCLMKPVGQGGSKNGCQILNRRKIRIQC